MARRPLVVLVICLVVLQIAYPLTRAGLRAAVTVAVVVVFASICVVHVAVTRGAGRALAVLTVTAGTGYAIEVVGVHTGFPFGSYAYSGVLGWSAFDVPLVIGLAWTMLCWPAALVARRLVRRPLARVLVGAWATTAGDLFLDPQMVATGAWRWRDPAVHLPGVPDVALSNYAGWLLATVLLSALVQAVMGVGRTAGDDALGVGLYLWSWVAWTTALAVFLDLRAAALWGAVAMGTVAVPVAVTWVRPTGRTGPRCDVPVRRGRDARRDGVLGRTNLNRLMGSTMDNRNGSAGAPS